MSDVEVEPLPGPPGDDRGPLDRAIGSGIAVFRLVIWSLATILVVAERQLVTEPAVAIGMLALAGLVSVVVAVAPRVVGGRIVGPLVVVEVATGTVMVALAPNVLADQAIQTFGSAWPVAGVLAAAVWGGTTIGITSGLVLTAGRAVGEGVDPSAGGFVAAVASGSLFVLAGAAGGWLVGRLRAAEHEIADTRVREQFGQELHDGVLQTLAVVQRRSDDVDLVDLARRQEQELRALIAGDLRRNAGDLGAGLRGVRRTAHDWDLRFELAIVSLPEVPAEAAMAITAAVNECVNNAGKHADASKVTVFVDATDGAGVIEIVDDGRGFDADAAARRGLATSVVGPIEALGGTVTISPTPGSGTRVGLQVPLGGRS